MMFNSSKSSFLIQIGIALGVVFFISLSVVLLSSDIGKRTEGIIESNAVMNNERQQHNNLAKLKADREEVAGYLVKLNEAIPDKESLLSIPDTLNDMAVKDNVGIQFSFLGGESEDNIKFNISIQGRYEDITNFVRDTETELIFMDIKSINLTGGGESYTASASGVIFFNG